MPLQKISRTVWLLSVVSLLTDTASEMLYPVMPMYLQHVGFSILMIGILEGVAEATAGLSKGYFGKLSDLSQSRMPFVSIGYAMSAISKPLMGLFVQPAWIFVARTCDRLGKGVRTGARDALLSEEATAATKASIFGFHRSMDTLGAVAGPLIALLYLFNYPDNYRQLFFIAFIPGLIAVFFTFFVREKKRNSNMVIDASNKTSTNFFSFLKYWRQSNVQYRKLVTGLLFFTLFNSSDVFLLLKARESGLSDTAVIGMYIFYNLVFALFAYPAGIIADKIGMKRIFIAGLCIFSIVYFGMSATGSLYVTGGLFFLYGIYAAATEGISKAWITNISDRKDTATAIGTYTAFQSLATMAASTFAGLIWYNFGAPAAFILTGVASVIVVVYFASVVPPP